MTTQRRIYWLHTLSPTHAGTGRGVGYIDLPIDRDAVTHWPIIRGSGFKGVWRDWARQNNKSNIELAFGRADEGGESANSGSLIPTDAKLVCLPVRSFRGTFAWCTSSLCLQMLQRMLTSAGVKTQLPVPSIGNEGEAHHPPGTALKQDDNVYLEDLDFKAKDCAKSNAWADFLARSIFPAEGDKSWREAFVKRFVVLPNEAFDFLCETATEVHTRVRIQDDTKTVAKGALWTEESLPAESILAGVVVCERVYRNNGSKDDSVTPETLLLEFATQSIEMQIGGKATVGRGQVRCVFSAPNGGVR